MVADGQAPYPVRADAARLDGAASGATPGTELALLSQPAIAPEAASKPYQVQARIVAAGAASDGDTKLRLWREARAFAPQSPVVRAGVIHAALARRRDSLAIAIDKQPLERPGANDGFADNDRADVLLALADAAERLDELAWAESYLRPAVQLVAQERRGAVEAKLKLLVAEQGRRAQNASRQPVIQNAIEQDRVVRPRLTRSAQ